MDNIAHTLAGVALAEAGLRRHTALATATLAIGANLPDVDAFIYAVGSDTDALAFRRGWTHGVLAMVLLPIVLAGIMLAWDRFVRRRRSALVEPANPRWLLILAAIGIWSHPLLDLLNTYGVRLLMPFSNRWFYGDTLFIVDPWLWSSLAIGIVLSTLRRRRLGAQAQTAGSTKAPASDRDGGWAAAPARIAIVALVAYTAAMAISSRVGRAMVERQATAPSNRSMVAPVPANPFSRAVVRDLGSAYELGGFTWGVAPRYLAARQVPVGRDAPSVAEAARTAEAEAYLSWARFPLFTAIPARDSTLVRITDVRYPDMDWATVEVMVPNGVAAPAASP